MNNKMDVEAYIKDICNKTGLDFSKLVCGYGEKVGSKGRYVFDLRNRNLSDKEFAIKYFSEEGIFFIWRLHIKGRTVYSVLNRDLVDYFGKPVEVVKKGIEFSDRCYESVYVAKNENLIKILELLA